jgi:hypothetical protein
MQLDPQRVGRTTCKRHDKPAGRHGSRTLLLCAWAYSRQDRPPPPVSLHYPMGWNLATSSANPSRSLIRYASVLLT